MIIIIMIMMMMIIIIIITIIIFLCRYVCVWLMKREKQILLVWVAQYVISPTYRTIHIFTSSKI